MITPECQNKDFATLSALVPLRKQRMRVAGLLGAFFLWLPMLAGAEPPPPAAVKPVTAVPQKQAEKPTPKPAKKTTVQATQDPAPPVRSLPKHYQKSPALPALTDAAKTKARRAFQAAQEGAWSLARDLARDSGDPMVMKTIRWANLARPATNAPFTEIAAFVHENPDWPQQDDLKRNAEGALPTDFTDRGVLDWFESSPPLTFDGTRRYAQVLIRQGQTDKARAEIRRRWIEGPVPTTEQGDFLNDYRQYLSGADHRERLDRLIWDEHYDPARAMLRLVDADTRAVAEARLALAERTPGVDGALKRVPAALNNDPGLLFERIRWRRRNGNDLEAAQLLANVPPKDSREDAWWNERQTLARRMLDAGNVKLAYKLVSAHGHQAGLPYANAEWFSGWLALRYLNDPTTALHRFKNMMKKVETPISLSRAAYWAGRAALAAGQKDEAASLFKKAAGYDSTFYGFLAAGRVAEKPSLVLHNDARNNQQDHSGDQIIGTALYQAASRLVEIGGPALYYANYFMIRLRNDAPGGRAFEAIGRLALKSGQPGEAVKIGKAALNDNFMLPEIAYPVRSPLPSAPEPALIHAIIRQESLFIPTARSPVGALGLMQLMPDTARAMAKNEGLRHSTEMLTRQPDYNVRLGSAYLQSLVRRYDGAYILAIAAYNAGPSRVNNWIEAFGDPRQNNIDPIDWIERIPFTETRNYVHRVLENVQIYRARLQGGKANITIDQDLRRGRTTKS